MMEKKSRHFPSKKKGQAITEFIIALPVLLLLLFGIIEFGRLVFSWMAVQNAARFGMRYAVTGDFDESYCDEAAAALGGDYSTADMADGVSNCRVPDSYGDDADDMEIDLVDWARLPSIRDAAQAGGAGLYIDGGIIGNYLSYLVSHNSDDIGQPGIKGYYHVTICSTRLESPPYEYDESNYDIPLCLNQEDPDNKYLMDNAGTPGERVRIVISYRHNMLLPFISSIWPDVPLDGRREGIVENYRNARIISAVGGFTPAATWTATTVHTETPTATTLYTATNTVTPTQTLTPSITPVPSCSNLSITNFIIDDKEFRFRLNNDSGGEVDVTTFALDWANYLAVAASNQYVERIDIGEPSTPSSVSQYASSVVAFSTEWSTPDYGAVRAIGAPDVGSCSDNVDAWAPFGGTADPEYLHLGFSTPVHATGVRIHETFEGGFVTGVTLVEPGGTQHALSIPADNTSCGGWFEISFSATSYQVDEVIIHTAVVGWEEIDAVQLLGDDSLPSGQIAVIYPSPGDVSPIIETGDWAIPPGSTDIIFNFHVGQIHNASDIGDFGTLLVFSVGGEPCILDQPAVNEPPPTATTSPTATVTSPAPTATTDPYAVVPGPDGEIWYRVSEGDGFAGDSWVKVEWHTNPDGSVTAKTTFSETFVDNSYAGPDCGDGMGMGMDAPTATPVGFECGDNSIGWPEDDPHTWRELWHSDHLVVDFKALDGSTIFEGKFDYIQEDGTNGCVTEDDGAVYDGDASDIVSCNTSMLENTQLACYDPNGPSPKADENYTQDPTDPSYCPGWQYSVWYETTLSADAFTNFGYPLITYIHASPAKTADSKPDVVPGPTVAATPSLTVSPSTTPSPTNTLTPTNTPSPSPTLVPTETNTLIPTPGCPADDPRYPDC